jgi:hypothetical protein
MASRSLALFAVGAALVCAVAACVGGGGDDGLHPQPLPPDHSNDEGKNGSEDPTTSGASGGDSPGADPSDFSDADSGPDAGSSDAGGDS